MSVQEDGTEHVLWGPGRVKGYNEISKGIKGTKTKGLWDER